MYGYPQHHNKHLTCDLIKNLSNNASNNRWILFGDLNMVLNSREKYGGNPIDNNITTMFRSTLTLCGLQHLGFEGDIFTWNNRNQGDHLLKLGWTDFWPIMIGLLVFLITLIIISLDINLITHLLCLILQLIVIIDNIPRSTNLSDMSKFGLGIYITPNWLKLIGDKPEAPYTTNCSILLANFTLGELKLLGISPRRSK
jgi:hypothetical protein